ncbi:hypothetical protein L1987_53906 [Smallanthus sonchifolius]|uniref:Uncharacterized protein n=1 Tax=Smallanthus sonchifolius TaxID=185202 RepID=A0ACB9E6B6_9ASTR|nr:hypothetical protein L1987_53906 [Smallanthus sonchifolius]
MSASGSSPDPVKTAKPPAIVPDEDGFTIVNRKGKNKAIKLQRKKKQVVVRANPNGLKSNPRSASSSGDLGNQVAGLGLLTANPLPTALPWRLIPPPVCSNNQFAALNVVSELDPFDQNTGTGTTFTELDIHASIKRTSLVEAPTDLYPHEPMNEDGTPPVRLHSDVKEQAADKGDPKKEKLFCQINREHIEGARLLPTSILSSPSPGDLHTTNGGKTYSISESQRKAIADRISVSSSICIEETVNWCPGEWDYFNDLCMSLGLDPDYCIEDVESDMDNGTAQFISDPLKAGSPKANRSVCMVGNQIHSGPGKDNTPTKITCPSNLVGMLDLVKDRQERDTWDSVDDEPMNDTAATPIEEDLHMVLLNKEYTGDSILDNLSSTGGTPTDHEAMEDDEMKVDGQTEWARMTKEKVIIEWPESWNSIEELDLSSRWGATIHAVRNAWVEEFAEGRSDLHQSSIFTNNTYLWGPEIQIFKQFDPMVECLAKWEGSHKLNDHEAWRKETGQRRALPNWLDVERGECNPEETMQRDKKKKRKHKGRNPFKNQNTGLLGKNGHDTRRKIKVQSSKNQNFLKSLSHEAVTFSNSGNIPKVIPPPLGFGEFRMGKASPGNIENRGKTKVSQTSKLDRLYEELAAKEVKLKEIAGSVLKTDANRVLLNSILGMKACKLNKFSAHVNAQGMVTIDEDMRPRSSEERERDKVQPGNKLSIDGAATVGTTTKVDDGFTVVRNRKSGNRQSNSGIWNNSRSVTNKVGHRMNVPGTQPGSRNRQNGTGIINTYERNIVSNHNGVNAQAGKGKEGEGEEQEGLSNASNYTTQKVVNEPMPMNHLQELQGKGKPKRTSDIHRVETSNKFMLLDEDGNEMGYLAANRENDSGQETNDSDMVNETEHIEEVESETDATTMMMNPDGPTPLTAEGHTIITENSEAMAQPPVAMLRGDLSKCVS